MAAWLVLVSLAGCAPKVLVTPETARLRALAAADARWANRAQPGELDALNELWLGMLGQDADDAVVLARLARLEWTRAWLDADRRHFENAGDFGYRCLLTWPNFAAASELDGYRITARTAAALPAEAAPCLTWTVVGGLSLVEARGPGAALELEAVRLLLDRLTVIGAPEDPGFLPWAQAMVLVLEAAPASPPATARGRFAAAIEAAPGVLLFRRTFATYFPDAANVAMDGYVPADAWALENAAWAAPE